MRRGLLLNFADMTSDRRRSIASQGGKAKAEAEKKSKKLERMAEKILLGNVPLSGKLGDILYNVGIPVTDKMSAIEAIIGVFTAKAMSGDLKAAYFVMDCAGWTLQSRERKAHARLLENMADDPSKVILEENGFKEQKSSLEEIEAEARKMGIYSAIDEVGKA